MPKGLWNISYINQPRQKYDENIFFLTDAFKLRKWKWHN